MRKIFFLNASIAFRFAFQSIVIVVVVVVVACLFFLVGVSKRFIEDDNEGEKRWNDLELITAQLSPLRHLKIEDRRVSRKVDGR